ncbi:SDR family oxidoreductase [Celeribacter litoreus]|uniref:SDR family oxidoreductase n=1 Tax=Celeribacter litoreus TaxID=2876714 RepID=UPI001CCEF91E|nr:SDR family oxidoreductase [Celeribacter litoreus]MCA0043740.1 SDR family oxidoreductase [Celeribacter litoreus]
MKTVLITGSSSGIGRGCALRFAKAGYRIIAHGRDIDRLRAVAEKIEAAGGTAKTVTAEMGDMDDIARLADEATEFGPLSAVIHCAAKFTYGPVDVARFEDWDKSIDSVLRATIRLTAHTLEAVKQAEGAYVYICGPTAWLGWKNHAIHSALRHAQAGFARALFEDVREDGVRVTLIHPGFVNTPASSPEGKDRTKMIQVEDIAEMIFQSVTLPNTACVSELHLRPQRSPYL